MLNSKNNNGIKPKKTAWELIEEIPNTPEQKRIDREISAIERRYEKSRLKKQKNNKKIVKRKTKTNIRLARKDFGSNAGKIWNALELYGPLNQSSIIKNTKLSRDDFFIGIGWLARENKISKDMYYYKLGDTNLKDEIGENAGKIWRILNSQGQADVLKITKLLELRIEDIYSAIGWLSRENKIKFLCKDNQLIYELT